MDVSEQMREALFTAEGKSSVTKRFPFLIAAPFSRALHDDFKRCDWVRHTGSLLIRYLAAVMISNFSHDIDGSRLDEASGDATGRLISDVLRCLGRKATDGTWRGVFAGVLRLYRNTPDYLFVRELKGITHGRGEDLERRRLMDRLNRFIEIRNRIAHDVPTPEDKLDICKSLASCLIAADFLCEYPLLEIVRQDGNSYYYKRWMGQEPPTLETVPLESTQNLSIDFHLRSDGRFLNMYCLLFSLDALFQNELDLGILKVVESNAEYTFATTGEAPAVTSTIDALNYLIQILRAGKSKTERTQYRSDSPHDWRDVRASAIKISREYLSEISGLPYDQSGHAVAEDARDFTKYDPAAYQDRQAATRVFDKFIGLENKILVLAGSSGVGKSSFLVRMWERMRETDQIAPVIITAGELNSGQGFYQGMRDRFLRFGNEALADMAFPERGAPGPSGRIVVMVDAINESHRDPAGLLESISRDLRTYNCENLKVVMTSRPHAWDIIRGKADPPRSLFYLPDKESQRTFTVRITGFENDEELKGAFEKYKERYGLQTEFLQLGPAIRDLIRDPLVLCLLSRAYRGQPLPDALGKAEVYEVYKRKIIELGREAEHGGLQGGDFDFLNQIVALMADNEINLLDSSLIENPEIRFMVPHISDKPQPLADLINDPALNESYMRLTRAGILTELKGGGEAADGEEDPIAWLRRESSYSIGFRFESFFDREVGERLWKSYGGETQESPERQEEILRRFVSLMDRVDRGDAKPFLWGPLRVALALEMRKGHSDTLLSLACLGEAHVRDTLVSALEYYGKGYTGAVARVEELLVRIAGLSHKALPSTPERPGHDPQARLGLALRLAGDVADRLSLPKPLAMLASRSEPEIRREAIKHAFSVWERGWRGLAQPSQQRVPEAGREFFVLLTKRCMGQGLWTRLGLPNPGVLRSLFEFTGMLLMPHTRHEATRRMLWTNWSINVLQKSVFSAPGDGLAKRIPKWGARRLILFTLRGFVIHRLKNASPNVVTNHREFLSFFPDEKESQLRLSRAERESVNELVGYLDPTVDFDSPAAQETLSRAHLSGDAFLSCIAYAALCVHGARNPESLVPYCRRVFIDHPLGPGLANAGHRGSIIQFFYLACDKYAGDDPNKIRDDHLDLLRTMAVAALHQDRGLYSTRVGQYYNQGVTEPSEWDWAYVYRSFPLHWYIALYTKKYGDRPVDCYARLVAEQLERPENCDIHELRSLVDSIGAFRADLRCFEGMFEAVRRIMEDHDLVAGLPGIRGELTRKCECRRAREATDRGEEPVCNIRHCLLRNLGRVRNYNEQVVDEFLQSCKADQPTVQEVQQNQESESPGGVFARMDWFIMDALETKELRDCIIHMYGLLPSCRSLRDWTDKILRYFIAKVERACSRTTEAG